MRQRPIFWINPPAISSDLPYFPVNGGTVFCIVHQEIRLRGRDTIKNLSDALKYATAK